MTHMFTVKSIYNLNFDEKPFKKLILYYIPSIKNYYKFFCKIKNDIK